MLNQCWISGFADEIDESFDVQLRVLGQLNQKFVELRSADGINIADFTMEKAAEVKAKLVAAGVQVSALGSPIGKIGIHEDFEPHFDRFKHVVELAKFFETPNIRLFSFFLPQDEAVEGYHDVVFANMARMVAYAKEQNVVLLHENEKGIYGAMAPQCLELAKEFCGDNFHLIFDFSNFVQCGQDTLEAFAMLEPYVTYFHVKDAVAATGEIVVAGYGDGKLAEIFAQLEAKGFAGCLSIEPHLFHFKGLDALEQDGHKSNVAQRESDSIQAYKAAHRGLMALLEG